MKRRLVCQGAAALLLASQLGSVWAVGAYNKTDKNFATDAANAGVYEVQAAQVAAKRARDPKVRAYAQMLIEHHEKAFIDCSLGRHNASVRRPMD